ncbi:putative chromate transport protein [Mariniflexile rhizosphaerae]|uniref:chromate efflux transporter n=1 Tax=unclassified Mariniflexile TaxID=2643887 RepID=UPI000CC16442|nr:chromate efflux transporter [Mariniflexile sp. TRM1-10]AXP81248.1 putative chromate transport protein [Mariniflexile sp. TRM1-10]PLB18140.1 MAG: Chromate transport protein ChrA [Flavobacteriaceae bacterium FS1-H7996/R]
MKEKPTFKEALKFWTKLGFISFGGPAGQIAIMHEYLVDKKKWISDSKFLHALNYCMVLPGPEAQQLAAYIGWLLHGIRGGLAAGILFVLPSMFILLGLSMIYVSFGNIPWIYAMFNGLKPAVIAIVILALIKIGKKSLLSPFHYFVAFAAFVCIFFFNVPFPLIILGAVILAALSRQIFPRFFKTNNNLTGKKEIDEDAYYINKNVVIQNIGFNPLRLLKQVGTSILLWIIPLVAFYFLTSDFQFWKSLSVFFTKAAFVTFGGAYAVLPYVAQVSVEQFNWLTNLQMIDGLALGETTPGPLIMVLVFVGFMAGHNHFGNSLAMGTIGLVTTTFYTFLPCFLFIFAGAPIIERTQENKKVKEILSLVTAAVVGVILNLTIYLGKAVIFPKELLFSGLDYVALGWIVISFIAMYRLKIGMITWIGISAIFGLVYYLTTLL